MQIEVVIPVVTGNEALKLLESIKSNTVLPSVVHVIDNTPDGGFSYHSRDFNVKIYHLSDTGLNFAWNTAKRTLFQKAAICCFFNDDIVLNKYYFGNIKAQFMHDNIKVLCPAIVYELRHMKSGQLFAMGKRQGCCFAMKKDHLESLPYIPDALKTFFGDDWWFYHRRVSWMCDDSNFITHKIGVGVKALDKRKDLEAERTIFKNLIK